MPITVICTCGRKLKAPDSLRGKRAKCPACGQAVTISDAAIDDIVDWIGPPSVAELGAKNPSTAADLEPAHLATPRPVIVPQSSALPAPLASQVTTERIPATASSEANTESPIRFKHTKQIMLVGATAVLIAIVAGAIVIGRRASGQSDVAKGIAATESKDWELALSCFNAALQSDPQNSDWLARRGAVYSGLKRYEDAIHDCSEALRLDNTCVRAYCIRAFAFDSKGEHDPAFKDCDQAIQFANTQSDRAMAHRYRGVMYLSFDQIPKALADAQAAVDADPANENVNLAKKLLASIENRKSDLLEKLNQQEAERVAAVEKLTRLCAPRTRPQTEEEFTTAEAKERTKEEAEIKAAQDSAIAADKAQFNARLAGVASQSFTQKVDEVNLQYTADHAALEADKAKALATQHREERRVQHKLELSQQKIVDAITKQVALIREEIYGVPPSVAK